MTSTTSATASGTASAPRVPVHPVRRWSSRIGAAALVGIGIAHTVVNAQAFAAQRDTSWLTFAIFGPGVSVLAFAIAAVAWRYSTRLTTGLPGIAIRGAVAVGAALMCVTAVTVLRNHPELINVWLGPGPWSVIAGPALLVAALSPGRSRTLGEAGGRQSRSA